MAVVAFFALGREDKAAVSYGDVLGSIELKFVVAAAVAAIANMAPSINNLAIFFIARIFRCRIVATSA